MLEVAVGFLVFVLALFLVVDIGWALYHQIALSQAAKKTARYAGTNLHSRTDITAEFFRSVGPTMVSSTDSLTTVEIVTTAEDAVFASLDRPTGIPSVSIHVWYSHRVLGPWPFTNMTIASTATAQVSTWEQVPDFIF